MEDNGNGQKIKLYERVATLEECQKGVEDKLDKIENNHLPHLQAGIDGVNTKLWGVFITLFVMLIGMVINFYLK